MKLSLEVEGRGFDALKNLISDSPKKLAKQTAIAANRTAKAHTKEISRSVRDEVSMKNKVVLRAVKVTKKASGVESQGAEITVQKKKRESLKEFGARQTKKGVSYRISKKGKRGFVPGAFIASSIGGHAFKRKTKARLPIKKLFGVSVIAVFNKQKLIRKSREQVKARMEYEMNRRVRAVIVSSIRKAGRSEGLSTDQINARIKQKLG